MGDDRAHDRERRRDDPSAAESRSPDAPEADHPLLDLQRRVGNRAVSSFLKDARPDPRPALDADAEAEADRIAERAVPERGPRPTIGPDGRLPDPVRDALRPTLGDLGDVRVHSGRASTGMARVVGARAFTSGRDVHVDKAELARPDAARLLAHEAVHAARHGSERAADGAPLVHAKLRGTHQALLNMGGGPTSSKKRKLVGAKKNWDVVVEGVAAYEELEAALMKKGKLSPKDMSAATPKMLKLLASIEKAANEWLKANPNDQAEEWHGEFKASIEETGYGKLQGEDTREKAGRRQAVAMLLPRVRTEMGVVKSGKWGESLGLSDVSLRAEQSGKTDEGQKNVVQELSYDTPDGAFSGYFKEDKGFATKPESHEIDSGIRQADPLYGARNVAMARLDKLLQTNLMPRTEFATHEGKFGTVSETAQGTKAANLPLVMSDAERDARGGGVVSAEDPMLQKCLNKLQVLDAICGQLDRHYGNFYVQFDQMSGRVTGITGIDNDMAFGKDMKTTGWVRGAENYKEMPTKIDVELGKRILQIDAKDIRTALTGLLPPDEVESTVSRFEEVKETVKALDDAGGLTTDWGKATARETMTKRHHDSSFKSSLTTHLLHMTASKSADLQAKMNDTIKDALDGGGEHPFRPALSRRYRELPGMAQEYIRHAFDNVVWAKLKAPHWNAEIGDDGVIKIAMAVLNATLGDDGAMGKMELAAMGGGGQAIRDVIEPKANQVIARDMRRYGLKAPKIGARR